MSELQRNLLNPQVFIMLFMLLSGYSMNPTFTTDYFSNNTENVSVESKANNKPMIVFSNIVTIDNQKLKIKNIPSEKNVFVKIYNSIGIEEKSFFVGDLNFEDKLTVDLDNLEIGDYILKVGSKSQSVIFKVI